MSDNIARRTDDRPPCEGCGYDGSKSHCHRCHVTDIPVEDLFDHLRSHGYEPQRWPDGELVVVDQTLEPADFI